MSLLEFFLFSLQLNLRNNIICDESGKLDVSFHEFFIFSNEQLSLETFKPLMERIKIEHRLLE
jgi:hypothetical protein